MLGLSQQELATACGLRWWQQIQKYEQAASGMTAARLWRLAEVLEVPIGYFYDGLAHDAGKSLEQENDLLASREIQHLIGAYRNLDETARTKLLKLAKSMKDEAEA